MFKSNHEVEPYILLSLNTYVKSALTKFRFGFSDVACHRFRYTSRNPNNILCRLCHNADETEIHFLLCCPALHDLRMQLIRSKYYSNPCRSRFNILLASRNEHVLSDLALFLYKALKRLYLCIC